MSTLGERIKQARESKGYLQSQLAKLIGVKSGAVISNWEQDINKPDAEKIVRLCNVLDISASYLLDYYGSPVFKVSPAEEKLITRYRALDTTGRDHVCTVIEWELERIAALPHTADIDIDAEMEDYRRTLELQKKAAGESPVLSGGDGTELDA